MKFAVTKQTLKLTVAAATVCVLTPTAWSQGIGVSTLNDMMTPTPQKLERGKQIWADDCASCHGQTGAGDGPNATYYPGGMADLTAGEYRHGGGALQVHNLLARGEHGHPLFEHLPFQDVWAVTHYARSLGPTDGLTDPLEVVEQAMFEAREGVCNPAIKSGIDAKMKFQGEAQIKAAEPIYATNCASCHGDDGKGDGSAAAALNPVPRNFHSGEGWKEGTSSLAIFNVLANGIEGTSMAAFKHLPESERWALTHMIREQWLPANARAEATAEQVDAVCRSLSGGGSTETISIDLAMRFVAEDVEEDRLVRMASYGPAWIAADANANRGQAVYQLHCQDCHGPRGVGTTMGPYGASPPYLVVKVNQLEPGLAGGTYQDFAARAIGGAHIAIPDVTRASHIADEDWQALHAYVTSFEGHGEVRPASEMPVPVTVTQPTEDGTSSPAEGAQPATEQPPAAESAAPAEQPQGDEPGATSEEQ